MIPPDIILRLAWLGFKVVPLNESHKPAMAWTEVYENGGWTDLRQVSARAADFHNVATCFGKVASNGLYLNAVDADSENVINALQSFKVGRTLFPLIDSAIRKTWVTKTRRGFHVYWFSSKQLDPIHAHDCHPDWLFDLKTGKDMLTLPPSSHRADPNFHYSNIGQQEIMQSERLYDDVLSVLRKHVRIKVKHDYVPSKRPDVQREIYSLNDTERAEIATLVVRKAYAQGLRHQTALAVSGMLLKSGINFDSAMQVFEDVVRLSKDEEKRERYATLKETYRKPVGAKVAGYAKLHEISRDAAERIANILGDVIKRGKEA